MIDDLMLLAHPGIRARAYLQLMLKAGLAPAHVILMGDDESDRTTPNWPEPHWCEPARRFDPKETLRQTIARARLSSSELPSRDVNDPRLVESVAAGAWSWAVFSGGGILREEIIGAGPRWIHVHPGRLPDYRGSTCMYYSILAEGRVGASAFVMERGLDAGRILACREIEPPRGLQPLEFDYSFDAWLRATVLVDALESLERDGELEGRAQAPDAGQMFYIIHPVLKNLAVLSATRSASIHGSEV